MNSLWQKTIISVLLCCAAAIGCSGLAEKNTTIKGLRGQTLFESPFSLTSSQENAKSLLVGQKNYSCQSIDPEYRDFYSFETHNYNISICRQGEEWFYFRESKSDESLLILPATLVFGGDAFQAIDGKTTYFVGINSDGYYSSVMYGSDRMIFEPELPKVPTAVIRQQKETVTPVEVSTPENVETQNSDLSNSFWRVCTEDSNDLHPYLNGWQKFIGKSPNVINEYATIEGHNFSYSGAETDAALVETTDGLMVTLDITRITETIASICVRPIASF